MARNQHDELQSKIAKWLATQGYPLEMVVARAFVRARFRTQQAEYYEDPETRTLREIDVVAHAQAEVAGCLVRLSVCTECKVAKGKPWVLLTSPELRLAATARVAQRAASRLGLQFLLSVAQSKPYQRLQLFRLPPRPAFGLIEALTSGNDIAYAACMSASKAAVAQAAEADIANEQQGPLLDIAVPAIVIDGRLFECFLNEDGETVVNEVLEGTLVWRNPLVLGHTIIRVITLPYLPELVKEVDAAASLFLSSEDEIRHLLSTASDAKDEG